MPGLLASSVSLDGFIEGPDRELDWHMVDNELHSHFNEQLSTMGAFLNIIRYPLPISAALGTHPHHRLPHHQQVHNYSVSCTVLSTEWVESRGLR